MIKQGTGEKIACNKDKNGDGTYEKIVAHTGLCAFRFTGGVNEGSRIEQVIDPDVVDFEIDDTLTLRIWVKATNASARGKIKLRLKYDDATPKGKITLTIAPNADYVELTGSYILQSDNISQIKLKVQNNSTAGKIYADDVQLWYTPDSADDSAAQNLLPLPLP
jgi:hypothetical protein